MPLPESEKEEYDENTLDEIEHIKEDLASDTVDDDIQPIVYDQPHLNYLNPTGEYSYQMEAAEIGIAYPHSLIEVATGGGKTNIALIIIDKMKTPTLIIVHTIALMEQWGEVITKAGGTPAFLGGGLTQVGSITVGIDRSVYQYMQQYPDVFRSFGLLIYDEVHHSFADQNYEIMKVAEEYGMHVVGLTATVKTYEDITKERQDKYFPLYARYQRTIQDVQKSGLRVETVFEALPVTMTEEEAERYENDEKKLMAARQKLGTSNMQEWGRILKRSSSQAVKDLIYGALKAYNDENDVLNNMPEKRKLLITILKNNPDDQFIVFTTTIADSINLQEELNANGIVTVRYASDMSKAEKQITLEAMRQHKAQVMIGIKSIGEGIDLPDLSGIIFFTLTTKSPIQIVQKLGRVLRYREGKVAKVYVIYAINTKEEEVQHQIRRTLGE